MSLYTTGGHPRIIFHPIVKFVEFRQNRFVVYLRPSVNIRDSNYYLAFFVGSSKPKLIILGRFEILFELLYGFGVTYSIVA